MDLSRQQEPKAVAIELTAPTQLIIQISEAWKYCLTLFAVGIVILSAVPVAARPSANRTPEGNRTLNIRPGTLNINLSQVDEGGLELKPNKPSKASSKPDINPRETLNTQQQEVRPAGSTSCYTYKRNPWGRSYRVPC